MPSVLRKEYYNNDKPYKYQPIFFLDEEDVHGNRVRRLKDKYLFPLLVAMMLFLGWLGLSATKDRRDPNDADGVKSIWGKGIHFTTSNKKNVRHPLVTTPPKQRTDGSVRYLAFGSFDSWGYKLEDYRSAYPFLVDDNVHNAALHLGGPALGAVCTESMTGDEIFDVIVLDFFMTVHQGLDVLARRLRERFPNALILFVRRWNPSHILYRQPPLPPIGSGGADDGDSSTWIDSIRWKNTIAKSFLSKRFQTVLNQTDPSRLSFSRYPVQEDVIMETLAKVGGRLVELPHPDDWDATSALREDYMDMFSVESPRLLSEIGHEKIAERIRELVQAEMIADKPLNDDVRNRLGTWGIGDDCQMWYTTGIIDRSKTPFTGAKMRKFASKWGDKYALEFAPTGGTITVTNHFDMPRMLYMTYMTVGSLGGAGSTTTTGAASTMMTTSPDDNDNIDEDDEKKEEEEDDDDDIVAVPGDEGSNQSLLRRLQPTWERAELENHYPRTEVYVGDQVTPMILEPTNQMGARFTHSPRTVAVGLVPPGGVPCRLRIVPLQEKKSAGFRLTGLSFFGSTEVPFEHTLELEPADDVGQFTNEDDAVGVLLLDDHDDNNDDGKGG